MFKRILLACPLLWLSLWPSSAILAQPQFIISLYPPQHGLNIPADAELQVGLQEPLDPTSISDSSIYVWSDITGLHRLTVALENGNRDLRITPRHWRLNDRPPFNAGERVTVTLTTRLRYADGRQFEGFTWHYTVAVRQDFGGDFRPLVFFGGDASTYFYVADFNGDGWCDLVGDEAVPDGIVVFFNHGEGILEFHHRDTALSADGEVVDFERDGDQDIGCCGNRLVFNDGFGNFTARTFPERPIGFAKAHDFNNDGIIDFAIGNYAPDTLYFGFSQNGKSFDKVQKVISPFQRLLFYVPGLSYDLNNDGRIDFLYIAGKSFVSFQATDADSMRLLQTGQVGTNSFCGNDFDGDHYVDYAFTYGNEDKYITFFNDGKGQLNPAGLQRDTTYSFRRLGEAVACGDLDGDGDIDLAFANSNLRSVMPETYEPDVSIFLNDGNGNFSLFDTVPLLSGRPVNGLLKAVDFDQDGDLDLIGIAEGVFYVVANGRYATEVRDEQTSPIPHQFQIALYPNPVRDKATIQVLHPQDLDTGLAIRVFDIRGRLIRSWTIAGRERKGELVWDARDQESRLLPSGIYFVQASLGYSNAVKKVVILR
jgi:hypothetical protein